MSLSLSPSQVSRCYPTSPRIVAVASWSTCEGSTPCHQTLDNHWFNHRFGQNEREYFYKDDRNDRVYRRNRRFIKPIDVEAHPPPKQPVPAPPLLLPAQPKGNPEVAPQVPGNIPSKDMEPEEVPASVPTASRPTRVIRKPVRFRD